MKIGVKQTAASVAVFGVVLAALVSVDGRVRERFVDLVVGSSATATAGQRMNDLVDAVVSAVRHQSIENAPLMLFAVVGAVLVIFMVKT